MYYNTQSAITAHTRPWVQSILWACIWWVVLVVGAMLWAAPAIRHMALGASLPIKIGPLVLVSVAKTPDISAGSFTLAYAVRYGIVLVGICCFIVQALLFVGLPYLLRTRNRITMVRNR